MSEQKFAVGDHVKWNAKGVGAWNGTVTFVEDDCVLVILDDKRTVIEFSETELDKEETSK